LCRSACTLRQLLLETKLRIRWVQLGTTKLNKILHFDFQYIDLYSDGKYQYTLLLKDDLSGCLWLVASRTADAAATVG
jgi:hypothetical protein